MQNNNDIPDLGPRKKAAKALAQKLIKAAGITVAPVSLQRIIEHLQKTYTLDVRRIEAGEKVSGLLVVCKEVDGEYATIGFNGTHSWCRRRFTIAHEIGHLIFGHACTAEVGDGLHNEKEADVINGIAFTKLTDVVDLKRALNREKDIDDILLIEDFLKMLPI